MNNYEYYSLESRILVPRVTELMPPVLGCQFTDDTDHKRGDRWPFLFARSVVPSQPQGITVLTSAAYQIIPFGERGAQV